MNEQLNNSVILPTSPLARIFKVKFSIVCSAGHTWGVALLPSYGMPLGWDVCLICEREKAQKALVGE